MEVLFPFQQFFICLKTNLSLISKYNHSFNYILLIFTYNFIDFQFLKEFHLSRFQYLKLFFLLNK